jgi:hypothetical protein
MATDSASAILASFSQPSVALNPAAFEGGRSAPGAILKGAIRHCLAIACHSFVAKVSCLPVIHKPTSAVNHGIWSFNRVEGQYGFAVWVKGTEWR